MQTCLKRAVQIAVASGGMFFLGAGIAAASPIDIADASTSSPPRPISLLSVPITASDSSGAGDTLVNAPATVDDVSVSVLGEDDSNAIADPDENAGDSNSGTSGTLIEAPVSITDVDVAVLGGSSETFQAAPAPTPAAELKGFSFGPKKHLLLGDLLDAHHQNDPIRTIRRWLLLRIAVALTQPNVESAGGVGLGLDQFSAQFQVPVVVVRIDDRQRHGRVVLQVPVLRPFRGVGEAQVRSVVLEPHRVDLHAVVRPDGAQMPVEGKLEQMRVAAGDEFAHAAI